MRCITRGRDIFLIPDSTNDLAFIESWFGPVGKRTVKVYAVARVIDDPEDKFPDKSQRCRVQIRMRGPKSG